MFTIYSILLVLSLFNYGAVRRPDWLLLDILWVLAAAGLLLYRTLRRDGRVPLMLAAAFGGIAILAAFSNPKILPPLFAAVWCWAAARDNPSSVFRFFRILLVVGLLEAFLGMIQYFIAPGWIFGYINENSTSSGTLINRNHFAGLLEMLVPAAIALAYLDLKVHRNNARAWLYAFSAVFIGVGLVFSFSRMGVIAFVSTLLVLVLLLRLSDARDTLAVTLGGGLMGILLIGVLWVGIDSPMKHFEELSKDVTASGVRPLVYRDTLKMIESRPLGIGLGNYADVFRRYQTFQLDVLFDHAHNDYLEIISELGIPLGIPFWLGIIGVVVLACRQMLRATDARLTAVLLGCVGATVAMLLHSFADFNLQIPSNAMLFFGFLGIALASIRKGYAP